MKPLNEGSEIVIEDSDKDDYLCIIDDNSEVII